VSIQDWHSYNMCMWLAHMNRTPQEGTNVFVL